MLFDTHCHLTHQRFNDDRDTVIGNFAEAGLLKAVTIGTGIEDGKAARELAQRFPEQLLCTVGLDPFSSNEAGENFPQHLAQLDELLATGDYVGLGEIGLDYYYKDLDTREIQIARFEQQLELAVKHDLPVVIHVRDAHEDMVAVLSNHSQVRGVIHSFSFGPDEARDYLNLNRWMLSFNGMATFKRNEDTILTAAALCPADRLLVETDAPYLAPIPLRGKRCEPQWVAHTVDCIAAARGERSEDVGAWATRNACRLFRVKNLWPEELPDFTAQG